MQKTDSLKYLRILPIPLLIGVWEILARAGFLNRALFPSPSDVVLAFGKMTLSGELFFDIGATLLRVFFGFVFGSMLGILIGVLTARIKILDILFGQIIQILRPIPPIALVPLAVVWLGLGEFSKITIITWGVFFPVWVNTYIGVAGVDHSVIWAAQSLGANRRRVLFRVVLPASFRHVIAGMRVAIAIAFICVVVAEMLGASRGLGFRINTSYLVFRVDKMMVDLIMLGLLGAITDWLFIQSINKFMPWYILNSNH
ncbi:MAG TPA: ABC transporter permease [bacterium]|nr:ABC transporter permease [bacterium]HPN43941.1 ABC transporter permease [bacterium]